MTTIRPLRVETSARLHLGFLDPDATLGRRFGSIGLAIDGPCTVVNVRAHERLEVNGPDAERAREHAQRVCMHYGLPTALAIDVTAAIPMHAGLGSGTQLALALASAVVHACGREIPAFELAHLLGRGRRSGVGINLFVSGGLVVDGGHGARSARAPPLARLDFPPAWRVVLIVDLARAGLSGRDEHAAFAGLPPFPRARAADLCHVTLMQLLPAVAEADFAAFSAALAALQAALGEHFAAVQGGRVTSPLVARALDEVQRTHNLQGLGQSSWGPTGFVFVDSADAATSLCLHLRERFATEPMLELKVCAARNEGARITATSDAAVRKRARLSASG